MKSGRRVGVYPANPVFAGGPLTADGLVPGSQVQVHFP